MGFGSPLHWIVVLVIVLVLFGRGRISEVMGDFGKGIKSFKEGMSEADKPATPPPAQIAPPAAAPTSTEQAGQPSENSNG